MWIERGEDFLQKVLSPNPSLKNFNGKGKYLLIVILVNVRSDADIEGILYLL